MTLRLHYALRSDVGHVREGNEDSAYAGSRLLAVADGMGGHAAGEVASSTVIGLLAQLDEDVAGNNLLDALAARVREANDQLREMAARNEALGGMGTTVTALLSSGTRLGVLHVGDSRAYLLREAELVQFTHDHTLVQDLVDQGRITAEQATTHPQRSLLMRALDGREVDPDLSVREARRGDRYLLCTDGLSSVVSEETIKDALLLATPQEAVDRLVDLALKGGGPDNVTVVVADIVEDDASHDDHPLVAGAAAEKQSVPNATPATGWVPTIDANGNGGSAAARAAHFHRVGRTLKEEPPTEPEALEEIEPPPRRRPRRRIAIALIVVLVLLIAGGAAGWAYIRNQYYIGVDKDRVALFQGVDSSIAGISLSSVQERFDLISALPEFAQERVREGIPASGRKDAERILNDLRNGGTAASAPTPATPTATATATRGAPSSPVVCPSTTNVAAAAGNCAPRTTATRAPSR